MSGNLPERIGKFEILGKLGQGGMGEVFLARDPGLGREVALKVIGPALTQSEGGRERFLREARAAGTLSHPNLVTVHEFGEDEGVLYLVMELLAGEDLNTCLREGSLTSAEALEVMAQVCDGLAYAHGKGILHRDIKPSNVRVWRAEGRILAKVLDFGVARLQDSDLTQTGMLVGTFQYMAPEYLQTKKADARGDLYAVGVMLHEALVGGRPEQGPTTPSGDRGAATQPAQAAGASPGVSRRLLALAEKAVALDPSQRFQTATEFARALRAAQTGPGTLMTAAHRPGGNTIIPSLVTPNPAPPQTQGARQSYLADEEPEPFWRRHWPWGALILVVAGLAKWGLGPATDPRPQPPVNPPPVTREMRAMPPPQRPDPDPRWAPPENQGRRPSPEERVGLPEPVRDRPLNEGPPRPHEQPGESLAGAREVLGHEPTNVHAHAQRVVSQYRLGRFDDMLAALQDARAKGVDRYQLGGTQIIREMLQEEARTRRIPGHLMEAMRPYLPPPPEEQGQGRREPTYPR